MRRQRPLLFNAFTMNCVSHIHHGLWRRDDTRQRDYTQLDVWVELARILEAGCFDTLFLADVVGLYDNYRGGSETAIREAMQVPVNDPTLLIPAMAHATEHLGFAFTGSILAEHPYNFARRVSTLDHLTSGRVAWNIVTSYLPGAARNLGFDALPRHDDRYDRADDYVEALYKLWEGSWEDDAVVADTRTGVYADPDKVHRIDHVGPYYRVPGPHLCEPSPQRTPLLFQAGTSERGRTFAARHAECVFAAGRPDAGLGADLRRRLQANGRPADAIRVCYALSPVIGATETEARARAAELEQTLSTEAGLAHMSGNIGFDLGSVDLSTPIRDLDFNGVSGIVRALAESAPDRSWTLGDVARRQMSGQWSVGAPEQIADRIAALADAGADGFNIVYSTTPGTFVDFIDGVAPLLKRRGLMQTEYRPGTLREKITGGGAYLPDTHPGASHRRRRSRGGQVS